jgi:hypothetical protein
MKAGFILITAAIVAFSGNCLAKPISLRCDGTDTLRGRTDFSVTFDEVENWAVDAQYGIPGKMAATFSRATINYSGSLNGYNIQVTIDRIHGDYHASWDGDPKFVGTSIANASCRVTKEPQKF